MLAKLEAIVQELSQCDRQERIELLIDLARNLPPLPARFETLKDEAHRVPECQSPVFLFLEADHDRISLNADAPFEAPTVRGFVAILVEGLHGEPLSDAANAPPDLLRCSGIAEILGMQRTHGLDAVWRRLRRDVAKLNENNQKPTSD